MFTNDLGEVAPVRFATGNGLFTMALPFGAMHVDLGVNGDIFGPNSGGLRVSGTGVGSVPELSTRAISTLGFAGYRASRRGARRWRERRSKPPPASSA